MRQVGPGQAVGGAGQLLEIDALGGALAQVRAQEGGARRPVRRQDEDAPVEPSGAAQRRVDVPGRVGGGQEVDALVVAADAVELLEELVDGAAYTRAA